MSIKKLPNYIINKLKAGEIVERPASVIKELIENSVDAGSTEILVNIKDGGTSLIQIQDNGTGIDASDADFVLERYATSKIKNEDDLQTLSSYGFRGEALASIGEVSKLTIQTKTSKDDVGTKIYKQNHNLEITKTSVSFDHGTDIIVQDLFFNTPARQKFLKTPSTEYKYCQDIFFDFVLSNPTIQWTFIHNGKTIFTNTDAEKNDLKQTVTQIYKKDRTDNLHDIFYNSIETKIHGVASDGMLTFPTQSHIKIFVNNRPIDDRIVKKAIMQAFHNQIAPRMYPLVYLFIDILPNLVDVNVHPRKKEVRFLDTQMIYGTVMSCIQKTLSRTKIINTEQMTSKLISPEMKTYGFKSSKNYVFDKRQTKQNNYINQIPIQVSHKDQSLFTQNKKIDIQTQSAFDEVNDFLGSKGDIDDNQTKNTKKSLFLEEDISESMQNLQNIDNVDTQQINTANTIENNENLDIKIIGQLRNLYIIAQIDDKVLYVDQHALAERIAFEKMKKQGFGAKSQLLTPLHIQIPSNVDIDNKLTQLDTIGFECSLLSENSLVIYTVPEVFVEFPIDFENIFEKVLFMDEIDFDLILDKVLATKSCRISIKAGDKLSNLAMQQLISDAFTFIPGSFVCPHGRPFFVQIDKLNIDKMFDR